jgi:ribonuclease P protein component
VRLTARRQYSTVHERGLRVRSPSFTLLGVVSATGTSRIGITVSRKVGGAVVRNRVKRVFREIFRYNRTVLAPPLDLVLIAKPGVDQRTTAELTREFLSRYTELARRVRP